MPWSSSDAKRFNKKAKTPKAKRMWAEVANAALKRGLSDGEAIREANSVIKRRAVKAASKDAFRKAARGSIIE